MSQEFVGPPLGHLSVDPAVVTRLPIQLPETPDARRVPSSCRQNLLLRQCLEPGQLSVLFQPIVDVSGSEHGVHALECLIRGPKGTSLRSPEKLFALAREKGVEGTLDRACIGAALEAAATLPGQPDLSLNLHASTLSTDRELKEVLEAAASANSVETSRLIIEIVEQTPPRDLPTFRRVLDDLRRMGARIALDDVGLGHSNYGMILEVRPDYLKIDRFFVKGIRADFYRQAILESVCHLCHRVGARVIAEGIDNEADLETARAVGVDLLQGFLFSEPQPAAEYAAPGPMAYLLAAEAPGRQLGLRHVH